MAVQYESSDDVIRIVQTRRGFRVTMISIGLFWLIGAGMTVARTVGTTPTELTCDHATNQCTLTAGWRVSKFPADAFVAATLLAGDDPPTARARLEVAGTPRFHLLCGADDPAGMATAKAFVAAVEAFRIAPAHPPITRSCVGREVSGPSLMILLPVSLLGWLFVLLKTFRFSDEVRATLDRHTDRIQVTGRGWFRRPWQVDRPLHDVTAIDLRSRSVGRGQRSFQVYAVFVDGSDALLWSPAAVLVTTLEQRVAAMRSLVESARSP